MSPDDDEIANLKGDIEQLLKLTKGLKKLTKIDAFRFFYKYFLLACKESLLELKRANLLKELDKIEKNMAESDGPSTSAHYAHFQNTDLEINEMIGEPAWA